ncbi:MAG: DUF429 domain-containing protein [Dehalococcoidia bacterium]
MKYPTFFGIDLTSTEAKATACLGVDNELQLVYLGFLTKNEDIIILLDFYSPRVIGIDAPLSLPQGLCCLEESCACQPKFPGKNRQCDQELRKLGIPCYPTSKKTFVKGLIYRGIDLKTSLNRQLEQASQVIEVYPFASKVRLFGKTMPRKITRQGMSYLKEKMSEIMPGLRRYSDMLNHDLCDAAVAAYTALLYDQNRVKVLGNSEEGLIFIPD